MTAALRCSRSTFTPAQHYHGTPTPGRWWVKESYQTVRHFQKEDEDDFWGPFDSLDEADAECRRRERLQALRN